MTELSDDVIARSRKNQSVILQRIAEMKNTNVAKRAGVDESTVSRFTGERLEPISNILAAAGLRVVSADTQIVSRDRLRMLKELAVEYIQADLAHEEINIALSNNSME